MIKPECHLWGKTFLPKLLNSISDIKIFDANEPEDIGQIGLHKDKKIPYGACSIVVPDKITSNKIKWLANFIIKNKTNFIKAGATDITLWIYWYGAQGNMEFTIEELHKISQTNIPMCIDYIYGNE